MQVITTFFWVIMVGFVVINPSLVFGAEKIKMDPSLTQTVNLVAGKAIIVETDAIIKRLAFAEPDFVEVKILSPQQIYMIGRRTGSTNATIWGVDGKIAAVVEVEVVPDITGLKAKIYEIMPEEKEIQVTANKDSVILRGTISNAANLSQVISLAEAYSAKDEKSGAKVINLLEVGGVHQVMLEVRVSEMSRTLARKLGVNLLGSYTNGDNKITIGFLNNRNLTINDGLPGTRNLLDLPLGIIGGRSNIGAVDFIGIIDALKENGLTKVLAEPTLITTSGRPANFLAGGEYPIPVPNEDGITIEYKTYGVGLNFTPTVLSSGKISMLVSPEVSELDFTNAVQLVNYTIPAITTRRVSTSIELADGQSFAIAGLLRDDVREGVQKFPVLGDIPVLGALFRSTEYQNNQTELVIIVTPHLVKPVDMAKQTLPTDQYVEPNDFEFYLLGKMEGNGEPKSATKKSVVPTDSNSGGLEGDFGHIAP
jgi:pilus assembly protein CpaC